MAFEFLKDLAPILGIGAGIFGATRRTPAPRGTDELMAANQRLMQLYEEDRAKRNQLLDRAGTLDAAAMNERNPLFQALVRREGGNIRGDFITALNELRTQNAKARARRTPGFFVNPDRRDEAVTQAIGRRFDSAQGDARTAARGYLQNAANLTRSTAGQYGGAPSTTGFAQAAGLYGQADARTSANRAAGLDQVLRGIDTLGSRMGGGGATGRPRQRTAGMTPALADPSGRPLDYYFNPDALRMGTLQ